MLFKKAVIVITITGVFVIDSNTLDSVGYFRSKSIPLSDYISQYQPLADKQSTNRILSRIRFFTQKLNMSDVPIYVSPKRSGGVAINVMGVGSTKDSVIILTKEYTDILIGLDDDKFKSISKMMLHELFHIKRGITHRLFSLQLGSLIYLCSLSLIILIMALKDKSGGGEGFSIAGQRLLDKLVFIMVRVSLFLALAGIPLYILFRLITNYYDNKIWSHPVFTKSFFDDVSGLVKERNASLNQGAGIPIEFHLLGCNGGKLNKRLSK